MKKKAVILGIALCLTLVLVLTGCDLFGGSGGDDEEYKVIFVGTSIPSAPIVNGVVTLPQNPTKEGYTFDGWYVDSDCTVYFDQDYLDSHPITKDIRLYHQWIPLGSNVVTFTLDVNGGNELSETEVTIQKGVHNDEQVLPIPTKAGFAFVGWYDSKAGGERITEADGIVYFYNGISKTLYARWEAEVYDVEVSSNNAEAGKVEGAVEGADYNDEVTVTATTLDENYDFIGWFDGEDKVADSTTYTFAVKENLSLVAKWLGEERDIYFYRHYMDHDDSAVKITFNYGSTFSYIPPRRSGYVFIGWYETEACDGEIVCVNGEFQNAKLEDGTKLYAGWSDEGLDQLNYEVISETEVKVTGVKSASSAIIHIPSNWSGLTVTTIGENAFRNSNKNAIVIPSSITTIEAGAFEGAMSKIYFDFGADLSLLNSTNFNEAQSIYTHLTIEEENALSDGKYVEANGIFADDYIDTVEEGRAFYAYGWLYTIPITLTISENVYDGNEKNFISTLINDGGVFDDVPGDVSLKSLSTDLTTISYSYPKREVTFNFSLMDKDGKVKEPLASVTSEGEKLQTQSKGLMGISTNGAEHEFAIDSAPEYVVYNSEQLVYAVEHGYKPVFGKKNTSAENCYNIARNALTQIINDEMNDFEKITAINDYIVLTNTYDTELLNMSTGPEKKEVSHYRGFYLEGVFEDGKAVCDGITKAFTLMCRIEGIEAIRISGKLREFKENGSYTEVGHAWSKVHLDDLWYTLDVTNNDSNLTINPLGKFESLTHRYFMVSDASIATTHIEKEGSAYPVSTGNYNYYANTKFDGENDLVITSQGEVREVLEKLATLYNNTDVFYTAEVIFSGVDPETLNLSTGTPSGTGQLSEKYVLGDTGIYVLHFIRVED